MVHVGKCAGSSVRQLVRDSPVVRAQFNHVKRFHFEQPIYNRNSRYLFVVRNPIQRAISAFNYRYFHVVLNGTESDRFAGEHEVLARYGSLESLANKLYSGGKVNKSVLSDWSRIHHLGDESFEFYLQPLIGRLRANQVFGVLAAEFLDEDSERVLGIQSITKRSTSDKIPDSMKSLSASARANLSRFLEPDYVLLEQLLEIAGSSSDYRQVLLAR